MHVAQEIVAAVCVLSRHRIGAAILVEPPGPVEGGVVLDARVSRELLVALFAPEYLNRLHRGAVLIRSARVERAAVPLTWADVVEHAADVGTGVAIAVDEDTGEIRIVERTGRVAIVAVDELGTVLGRRRR